MVRSGGHQGLVRREHSRCRASLQPSLEWLLHALHRVTGVLVELGPGDVDDVRAIDLLGPLGCRDFLDRDRYRFFSIVENVHHVLGDCLGKAGLLALGLAGPHLHDHMRHRLLRYFEPARYSSSLTCSSQSTALPSSCSWMAICVMAVVADAPSPGRNPTRT